MGLLLWKRGPKDISKKRPSLLDYIQKDVGSAQHYSKENIVKRIIKTMLLAGVLCFPGGGLYAAPGALNFTLEKAPGFGGPFNPLYRVNGSGINLEIKNGGFQNDPYARYEVTGNMFGRQLEAGNSIKYENFGGLTGVQIDAAGIYVRFFRQAGWPDLEAETRIDQNMDAGSTLVFAVLANYLPRINGAAHAPGDHKPTMRFQLRQFGPDMVLADGAGLSNVRIDRSRWGNGYRYDVRGSGFGKNFDGADRLTFETDPSFLGPSGLRARGCGLNLEIREEGFAGGRITVLGTAGDSSALVSFVAAFSRYLGGN